MRAGKNGRLALKSPNWGNGILAWPIHLFSHQEQIDQAKSNIGIGTDRGDGYQYQVCFDRDLVPARGTFPHICERHLKNSEYWKRRTLRQFPLVSGLYSE